MPQNFDPDEIRQATRQVLSTGIIAMAAMLVIYVVWSGVYTVREYERAVVLRFGRYHSEVGPGLHFKLPWIDRRVLIDTSERSLRLPSGTQDTSTRGQQMKINKMEEEQSLILTGDLFAAVVEWTVIWRVTDPQEYVFSINERQVEDTILAVARSTMHRVVGDYSADEILTGKRNEIAAAALEEMTQQLAVYQCGVSVVDLQLQRVTPPERVRPAFDDVNASIQQRDQLVNEARRERNKMIPTAMANSDKLIREAEGYAARRRAEAAGEIAALLSKYESYKEAPEVTRQRMYLESMERVLSTSGPKTILDSDLKGLLPMLNLNPTATAP
ncbi:FtsH protease activity modulator HflK [Rosistilla oblonga]|uniref:Protein HflK n=1 Tax=Rosistilla oblonga TaxID=2527990 RepID=A0A518IPP2_9BACT|nr:FtsH protease activity modulator HflK [Rosistilla oblonga]QDV55058.1 Modulator of FtsH protease HflK [Rosistilla oblonga]